MTKIIINVLIALCAIILIVHSIQYFQLEHWLILTAGIALIFIGRTRLKSPKKK